MINEIKFAQQSGKNYCTKSRSNARINFDKFSFSEATTKTTIRTRVYHSWSLNWNY